MRTTLHLISFSLVSAGLVLAQPRICVPLRVIIDPDSTVIYFGMAPGAHYCIVGTDTVNGQGEFPLPPLPPQGVFDARFGAPQAGLGPLCFYDGSPCDFRPLLTAGQRDTFKVRWQYGSGTTLVMRWPSGLARYFSELWMGAPLLPHSINMLVDTVAFLTAMGDPGSVTIYSVLGTTSTGPPGKTTPPEFRLAQNYPNPFNPSTTIEYDLPLDVRVSLKVFNILGQEVATLIDGYQRAGFRSVKWNASGLASGVYFYRLDSGSFTGVKKLVLAK